MGNGMRVALVALDGEHFLVAPVGFLEGNTGRLFRELSLDADPGVPRVPRVGGGRS